VPAAFGQTSLRGPLVVNTRWPQPTDLRTWTQDVMRIERLQNAPETAQAKAFFEWLRLYSRMATGGMIQAYEGETGKEKYVTDAHKNLFVYGWGFCDTTSRIAEAAWSEFKSDRDAAERVCVMHDNGGYHTMYRLKLDGHWGAFDPRYGYYLVDKDAPGARILDWNEVGDDARILANRGYKYRSRPFFEFFKLEWDRALLIKPTYFKDEPAWIAAGKPPEAVFGNRQYQSGTRFHDMDFQLPQNSTIERFWNNSARKFYVPSGAHTKREEAFLPAGRFYRVTETMREGNWPQHDPNYAHARDYLEGVPTSEGYNAEVAGGRTIGQSWGRITTTAMLMPGDVWDLYSPYILVGGKFQAGSGVEMRTLKAKPQHAGEPDEWSSWNPVASVQPYGVYRNQLRTTTAQKHQVHLELFFENGIMTLPRLLAGRNPIEVKLNNSKFTGRLHITYRYKTANGEDKTHEQTLTPADFKNNVATYTIDAPGLKRCDSVAIRYGVD
jgi:hypothetical protein